MSIHQDYLERSRMSTATGRMSVATSAESTDLSSEPNVDQEYGADDYGGDDDNDFGFDEYIKSNDANADRYSSISFENETFLEEAQTAKQQTTTALLNTLCNDMTQNDYQFFSQETLDKLGNSWAGAAHWKKSVNLKKATEKTKTVKKTATKKKMKKQPVNLAADISSVSSLLKPAPKNTQLSKAMIAKYGKADNVLPLDAGMGMDQLSKLFLRPTAIVRPQQQKTVGFADQVDNWDDGSFGDDGGDGPGFEFADDEDFVVAKLDDIRKVDKIHVGYAMVAKKVDVKRLKKDLWSELECKMEDDDEKQGDDKEETEKPLLSFKETVQEMEKQGQSQTDVTLPFYFICLLHLANEKGLALESTNGLHDFSIAQDWVIYIIIIAHRHIIEVTEWL